MTKHLSRNLASMLVDLVKESEAIPAEVIELVLSQFEHYGSKPDTPSFDLTVQVCNRTADKFQRPILAHFKEIQDQHGHDPSGSDLKTLAESHDLLKIIFRQAPDLLLNVIPMLEEDLQIADEPVLRQLSTETLGTMFTEQPTVGDNRIDFVRLYSGIWKVWLGRSADKVIAVRVAWIAAAGRVLVKRSELRKDIESEFTAQRTAADSKNRSRSVLRTPTSARGRPCARPSARSSTSRRCTSVASSCARLEFA
jgi:sister-chromatid-cohesion protein PDS5